MTKRLKILQNSLEKKEKILDKKFENHFDSVSQANGQPLNDKRNGFATFKRWDRQNDSIRRQIEEVAKTKKAIEKEQFKIDNCDEVINTLPEPILELLKSGDLTQWRKFPNRFFVKNGGCGRIVWEGGKLLYAHLPERGTEEFKNFARVFNDLKKILN